MRQMHGVLFCSVYLVVLVCLIVELSIFQYSSSRAIFRQVLSSNYFMECWVYLIVELFIFQSSSLLSCIK